MKNEIYTRKVEKETGESPLGAMNGLRIRRLPYLMFATPAFLLFFLALPGCGNDLPDTIPVSGVITFDGEAPPSAGVLIFAHTEGVRPAVAMFDDKGRYTANAYTRSKGLVPGRYVVRIECWRQAPTPEVAGISYLPEGFEPPELVVSRDEKSRDFSFDVPGE